MSRRPAASTGEPSYDSFLDIVANLVGILVILIMVLGVRAKDAWQEADNPPPEVSASVAPALNPPESDEAQQLPRSSQAAHDESSPGGVSDTPDAGLVNAEAARNSARNREPLPDIETPRRQVMEIRQQLLELDEQSQRLTQVLDVRRQHESQWQRRVHLAEDELEKIKLRIGTSQDTPLLSNLMVEIDSAQRERDQLQQRLALLDVSARAPTVLRNEPTPLARTVDGNEIHLRLLGGRVAYVPITEAVTRLSQVVAKKVWRLKNSYEVKDQLEPRYGFTMHYTLVRRMGPGGREAPALGGFVMVPESDQLGEEITVATGPDSELAARLASHNPRMTTVTVWTYPDSFSYFRTLKTYLLDRGFQVAARPLPTGYPIAGSPEGSRSAAQ